MDRLLSPAREGSPQSELEESDKYDTSYISQVGTYEDRSSVYFNHPLVSCVII